MALCKHAQLGRCWDSPLAHDLADVAGPLQQLGQEELGVWDATYDLLWCVGWKSTTMHEPPTPMEQAVLQKVTDLNTGLSESMGRAPVRI